MSVVASRPYFPLQTHTVVELLDVRDLFTHETPLTDAITRIVNSVNEFYGGKFPLENLQRFSKQWFVHASKPLTFRQGENFLESLLIQGATHTDVANLEGCLHIVTRSRSLP
jgi:hypothetical protein